MVVDGGKRFRGLMFHLRKWVQVNLIIMISLGSMETDLVGKWVQVNLFGVHGNRLCYRKVDTGQPLWGPWKLTLLKESGYRSTSL